MSPLSDLVLHVLDLLVASHNYLHYWTEFQFFDGIFAPIYDQFGATQFALLVAVVLFLDLLSWSRGLTLPATVLTLLAGTMLASVPGPVATIGWVIIVLAVAIGLFGALWRAMQ